MLEQLLSKFIPSQDALTEAGLSVLERQIAPFFAAARSALLERVTGDPPAQFGAHLAARGLPLEDQTVRVLWGAVIAALADEPCTQPTDS